MAGNVNIVRLSSDITSLVNSMLDKIPSYVWDNPSTTFLDPSMGSGQFVSGIERRLKERGFSNKNIKNRVFGFQDTQFEVNIAVNKYKLAGTYSVNNFLTWKSNMKFDVIIGNPPYQTETDGNSRPIWDKFVDKSFSILNEDGYLSLIHPAGWRNVDGKFTEVRDLLLSKQMEYLEIHSDRDGMQTFGANTRYDWYVVKNAPKSKKKTEVVFEDATKKKVDLKELPFIPNHSYEKISSLIANPGEETVEIISNSSYHTQRKYVSKNKTKKAKYPLVYTVTSEGIPTLRWSSKNDLGHYDIPKLIWSNGTYATFLDSNGEYGLTEFARAIVDTPKNLKKIQKVMEMSEFIELMVAGSVGLRFTFNYRILSTFRKDFWKEFV